MRENWSPPKVELNIVSGRGGLGDTLARLPALKYLNENYSHVDSTVYIQDSWLEVVQYLLPPRDRLQYKKLSQAPFYLKKPYIEFDMERLTTLHLHLTDHAFLMLNDALPTKQEYKQYWTTKQFKKSIMIKDSGNWFREFKESKYIIFTTDYTAPTRRWPSVHINTLAKKIKSEGFTCVLLGTTKQLEVGVEGDTVNPKANDGINKDLFIDLRDKTTLIEALGIMQRSKAVVGVDNGLLHLACYTDVPVVIGYTSLDPRHRVPVREKGLTGVLEAQVPCKGCQSMGFAINHDWRTCLFDDYACTLTLTADRFYEKLKELEVL